MPSSFDLTKFFIVRFILVPVASGENDKDGGLIRDILKAFPKVIPLAFSHHPDCKPYRNDVIRIGKIRLCRGCTISFTIAGVMILLYLLSRDVRIMFDRMGPEILLPAGVILGMFQVLRAFVRRMGIPMKTLIKIALGVSISLIAIGVIELDLSRSMTGWALFGLFILYGLFGAPLRFYYMKKTCEECEYKADLGECEGLKFIKEFE
jgi:hypothetical protein